MSTGLMLGLGLAACGDDDSNVDPGTVCGGLQGKACAADQYCDFGDNRCAIADGAGVCAVRPEACTAEFRPVCGCDAVVYGNACEAAAAGVDVMELGGCDPPEGMFACGHRFCDLATSYCRVFFSDIAGEPNDFECIELPAGCGDTPDCACLADETCGDMCEVGPAGALRLICPGG